MSSPHEKLGMEIGWKEGVVGCIDTEITFSRPIASLERYQQSILLRFRPELVDRSSSDVDIPLSDNLVRVNAQCMLGWIVGSHPDAPESTWHHHRLNVIGERIITLAKGKKTKHFHEVDPETGDIVDTWPRTQFKIGGKTNTFESPVNRVDSHQGRTFIETSYGFHAFSSDGARLWSRPFDTGNDGSPCPYSGGPKPVLFHERTVTIRTSTEGRAPFYPTFEIELDSGDLVEGYEQMTPGRANEYLDFDTVDGWLPVRTQNSVAVLDDRGDVVWEQSFDEELLDAATTGRVTVVETKALDDESSPVSLLGFDADGTQLWKRHASTELTVLPAEDAIHLLDSDGDALDGETCTVELDAETGAITGVIAGDESFADRLLE